MAEIVDQLNAAKTAAMKSKMSTQGDEREAAELRLAVLRNVIGEIERDSKEKKPRGALAVLKAEHSKRVESEKIYREALQLDRANREGAEAKIVESFLPYEAPAPTELELQYFIADYIGANGLEGSGNASLGQIMKVIRDEFENFDGKVASGLARQMLSQETVQDPSI